MGINSVAIPGQVQDNIDKDIKRIGYNVSRSAWIVQACKEKLENTRQARFEVLRKLKQWHTSFPKRPFKEVLEEIENEEI